MRNNRRPRGIGGTALSIVVAVALVFAACGGDAGPEGPPGPQGPPGPEGPPGAAGADGADATVTVADLTCVECHNDGTGLVSKQAQFSHSLHATGEAYVRGGSAWCASCHGSEPAEARIEAGLPPDFSVEGVVNVSPYTCRTCHDIHTTYTAEDFSLTGDLAPAPLAATASTFDGGAGNLCANCHQIRNELPVSVDGEITFETTRFGTHHGAEAQMLLGEGGLGVSGSPSIHYQAVEDTCVTCHMGDNRNHTFEPDLANCQTCHADLDTFDRNGVQTEIQAMLDQIQPLLIEVGIMNGEEGFENRSIAGTYPEEVAQAMWNYMFVLEDQSRGVHNPPFARALLEQALTALGG